MFNVLAHIYLFLFCFVLFLVLPDTTTSDLDQHLGLVSTQSHTNHSQSGGGGGGGTGVTHPSSLLVPRYSSNHSDFSLSGPRSLSDNSSTAESPVQDDLLSQSSLVGGVNHVNNTNFPLHQNMTPASYSTSNCNNSLYPVLPASLLYSQLYSAANQTHNFHSFSTHTSATQGTGGGSGGGGGGVVVGGGGGVGGAGVVGVGHHSDLQSVMDQLTSTSNQRQMNGTTDILLTNNGTCAAAAARQDDAHTRGLNANGPQRGQAQSNDAVVWRPY